MFFGDNTYGAGNLASIYYEQAQVDMAVLYYKQAIACDAGFLEAYNNLVCPTSFLCGEKLYVHCSFLFYQL